MFKKGQEDWPSVLVSIGFLLIGIMVALILAWFLLGSRSEKINEELTFTADSYSLDALLGTEIEMDNEIMSISEVIYKWSKIIELQKAEKYKEILHKEVKKIIDKWNYDYENWFEYRMEGENNPRKVKTFSRGYAVVIERHMSPIEILGEGYNKDKCFGYPRCKPVAIYWLSEYVTVKLFASQEEV